MKSVILLILLNLHKLHSLDNGAAILPPMGWSSWQAFGCKECNSSSDIKCLSEAAIKNTAKLMVDEGYLKAGYQYIIIDDCWQSLKRTKEGKLQADEKRFPNGIQALAKEVHNKNLKLGIFSDLGEQTGSGRPGSVSAYELDSKTFNEWDIDYLKMSAASVEDPKNLEKWYSEFSRNLQLTGRPIVYATSWLVYLYYSDEQVTYELLPRYCNTWRFGSDMEPKWSTILEVMDQYTDFQEELSKITKQGAWSDADLLMIGQEGITLDQSKAQMAVWAIMPSPLIFSADINSIKPEFKEVLQNEKVIAVNQDKLKLPGSNIKKAENIDIWARPISPATDEEYSYAIAFVNRNPEGEPVLYNITLKYLGLNHALGYTVTDLFSTTDTEKQQMKPDSLLQMKINPSGVVFFKFEINETVKD